MPATIPKVAYRKDVALLRTLAGRFSAGTTASGKRALPLSWPQIRRMALAPTAVVTLLLCPFAFERRDQFRRPVSYEGHRVLAYGISRLCDVSHADGVLSCANIYDGLAYIDYLQDGHRRRDYGHHLEERGVNDRSWFAIVLR